MSKTKNKWLFFLILILLISNVVLAFFLFSSEKQTKRRKESPSLTLYKEIGLSQNQIDTFKTRKDSFVAYMKPLWGEIRALKDSLYKNMDRPVTDSQITAITISISNKTLESDRKMYQHIIELRKLCTPDQIVRFDTLVPKFVNARRRR